MARPRTEHPKKEVILRTLVTAEMKEQLADLAAEEETSEAAIVRKAINSYLKKRKPHA